MGTVASAFINLHVKCPIFSAKDDEDAERHLSQSNDRMNLQWIAEQAKCDRFCLTLSGDAYIWYESITPVGNDQTNLQGLFAYKLPEVGQTQEELF